ncbi:uncharacterized protein TRIADDRAFT_52378 [Trichoplax adhaerens]|uniref:Protein RFT1 homolog n=1 Tax=Trichoplax adhaerens TaxID=10228 RepID=B3RI77_TRIAD|nr:hypothetical protein TRIADDRAFT_52378 [Trichoplax adhaerens]EDV28971.1 hypothetical protein TRIADDRAFT_52378 [Trichoplax adhaerens]|eukprot:XP_002108173.1 hypothetical protein TRIADDRAFT_52378 [Trichoplax adhaerens]
MTIFNLLDFGEQGIYDIVNNLGSLAARFIFLPIEESYYLFFAQTMQRDLPAEQQKSIKSASETLEMLLKLVFLISVTILVTFGGTNNLNDILHLGIGGVNFILVILIIYVKEEKLMLYIKKQYFVKKKAV